ncbi:oxidoreductase [Mucilaginibacter sp.]|uniref:oxidoreductase n=1 Tax=Mucilaginibacter sp. TaxID=1882438 RepID=UPI00260DBD14|nr:oxidoreductase [Mucilaginibacter sp.]MDB5127542.1 family NAD(P)-dependent oxidoreductase [Mucilaginibacter sp.]
MKTQKVWFITGASKGFGLEIAKSALEAGDKVVATVRSKPEQLAETLNNNPDLLITIMDVSNEAQVKASAAEAIEKFGQIDVLVNNAGYGLLSGVEEATDAEVRKQYDTNVFGLLNVTRAILPQMRKQRSGHVINVSSVFGFGSMGGWGLYGSTKFAVEGITEALALEVAPLGIKVTAVEPGLFSTDFLDTNSLFQSANAIDDYKDTVGAMRSGVIGLHGNQPGDPAKLGQAFIKLVNAKNPPVHLPLGTDTVAFYRAKTDKLEQEIKDWEAVTNSTNHDAVATA